MQTFLPYPDFNKSAQCLDDKRLGKQRAECLQILKVLTAKPYKCNKCGMEYEDLTFGSTCSMPETFSTCNGSIKLKAWQHHPIVKMWKGYESLLSIYGYVVCYEWKLRGFNDSTGEKIVIHSLKIRNFDSSIFLDDVYGRIKYPVLYPEWLGNEQFHLSHQSNLIRKLPEHYRPIFGDVPDNLPYEWYNPDINKFYHTK